MKWQKNTTIINLVGLLALLIFCLYVFQTLSLWNDKGRPTPVGEDFSIFWTASALSLAGEPAAAYDLAKLHAAQKSLIGETTPRGCGWYYPPVFLLMVLPLSLVPYKLSLGLWLALTMSAYVLVVRRIAPHPLTIWLTLAFPATYWNFFYAQNGFFSAALLGGGLLLLGGFPVVAGILLGFMCYKPQFAILIPLALLAGRCWKALMATIITIVGLVLISTLTLGFEVWRAFLGDLLVHTSLLDSGHLISFTFIPTFFSAAVLLGLKPTTAYVFQGILMLGVVLAIIWVWWREGPSAVSAAVLVLGILLFPHFYCYYDLTILALPIAWLGWEGYRHGWLGGEKIILLLVWFMPIYRFILWDKQVQAGPLILVALLVFALRRHYYTRSLSTTAAGVPFQASGKDSENLISGGHRGSFLHKK
jgi:alpha-1,2-mannosyltransferase